MDIIYPICVFIVIKIGLCYYFVKNWFYYRHKEKEPIE
jgi:hypothetical protein